jgi:polysaccharide biosynthesis protein PslF
VPSAARDPKDALALRFVLQKVPTRSHLMPTDYAMLSTYPPTQCGLATFSAALLAHLPEPGDHVGVVRVLDEPAPRNSPLVVHELINGCAASAAAAVEIVSGFDVSIVQHEYGIYGGQDGQDLIPLLNAIDVPSIVVLHTVLADPTCHQQMILDEIISAAGTLVTMTQTGRSRVLDIYGTDPDKVFVIPHGAAGSLAARPSPPRRPGGLHALTWGLLGPGKGIEHAIEAVAMLRDDGLRVDYTVAGQTHPRVRARTGEAYRLSLEARARGLGVGDSVHFDDRYLPSGALIDLVGTADVVLLPYDSLEQVTSGVLIEAVTAGKPVISTRFPHAAELLGGGAGLLVERKDPAGLADALRRAITEPGLSERMSRHAAEIAPRLVWPAVAASYRELASALIRTPAGAAI